MAEITWKSILTKLVGGDHLSAEESEWFVDDLMNGNANPAAVGAVLATQQQLGLTPDEVRGAAKAMVSHAIKLDIDGETTDIVGTGGSTAIVQPLPSAALPIASRRWDCRSIWNRNRLLRSATNAASHSLSHAHSIRQCASWDLSVRRSACHAYSTFLDL